VLPAQMVGLYLSHKENKNNSNDNDYKNNNLVSSPALQKEEFDNDKKNNNKDKPLAKLLVVDDDSDIVQVLKLGLLKNRFLVMHLPAQKKHCKASNQMQSLTV
jgi:hypothetical protein